MIKCWSSICDKSVCVCVYEKGSICVHINICSLSWFNSPLQHLRSNPCLCLWETVSCTDVSVFCFVFFPEDYDWRGVCCSERGSLLTQGWGAGKKSRARLLPPPALNPCFKICDLCAVVGVNTHTNRRSLFSFPLLGSRGQTVSWELESQ